MHTTQKNALKFGNWVPVKMIIGPGIIGILCLGLGAIHWAFFIPAVFLLLISLYFVCAWHIFSSSGRNLQDKIHQLVIDKVSWDGMGRALDIGCGNGPLSIKLAQRFPQANITGLDFWGKNWDYSMASCQENASIAGVRERITFRQGSASALPFEDASFDAVISNLTFHEVQDVKDKKQCIKEALRVLKPGGVFVLQDLFLLRTYYGTPAALLDVVRGWGVQEAAFIRTGEEGFIPGWVKLPFMIGAMAMLRGVK